MSIGQNYQIIKVQYNIIEKRVLKICQQIQTKMTEMCKISYWSHKENNVFNNSEIKKTFDKKAYFYRCLISEKILTLRLN